jgi:hypothetical protein
LLTMACASVPGEGRRPVAGPLPSPDTQIGRVASGRAYYCGDLGFVDMGAAVDGPAYYFRRRDGAIVAGCGGIRRPDPDGNAGRQCPPQGWTCSQPPSNLDGGGQ